MDLQSLEVSKCVKQANYAKFNADFQCYPEELYKIVEQQNKNDNTSLIPRLKISKQIRFH